MGLGERLFIEYLSVIWWTHFWAFEANFLRRIVSFRGTATNYSRFGRIYPSELSLILLVCATNCFDLSLRFCIVLCWWCNRLPSTSFSDSLAKALFPLNLRVSISIKIASKCFDFNTSYLSWKGRSLSIIPSTKRNAQCGHSYLATVLTNEWW